MRRRGLICLVGLTVGYLAATATTCGCHLHVWGRYDYRPGAVQEQQDSRDLVEQLLDEAAKESSGETSED